MLFKSFPWSWLKVHSRRTVPPVLPDLYEWHSSGLRVGCRDSWNAMYFGEELYPPQLQVLVHHYHGCILFGHKVSCQAHHILFSSVQAAHELLIPLWMGDIQPSKRDVQVMALVPSQDYLCEHIQVQQWLKVLDTVVWVVSCPFNHKIVIIFSTLA